MFPLRSTKFEPNYAVVQVNKVPIKMEIDTGATLSIVSEATYKQVWGDNGPPLTRERIKLHTYTAQEIPVKGSIQVAVEHGIGCKTSLVVTEGQCPSLLGRNWLGELRLDWNSTYQVLETND